MRDLSDVLADAADGSEKALTALRPDDARMSGVVRQVRRTRRRRAAVRSVAALPVVAALALGGWQLAQREPNLPPVTREPSPTSSPTPSPSPTPTPTPTQTQAPVATPLPTEPGLPERMALPPGLLERTTPGWVLAVYQPEQGGASPAGGVVTLTSPLGMTFEVTRLAPTAAPGSVARYELLDWVAGTTVARLAERTERGSDGGAADYRVLDLDLTTGSLADTGIDTGGSRPVATDGVLVWDSGEAEAVVAGPAGRTTVGTNGRAWPVEASEDGRYLLVSDVVIELATGDIVASVGGIRADGWCEPLTWWTDSQVLAACTDERPYDSARPYLELSPTLIALDVTADGAPGEPVASIGVGGPLTGFGAVQVAARDAVVVGYELDAGTAPPYELCASAAYRVTPGGVTPIATSDPRVGPDSAQPSAFQAKAAAGQLVVAAGGGCGEGAASTLDGVDLATGAVRTLLPLPADDTGSGGSTWWLTGPASWTLGR